MVSLFATPTTRTFCAAYFASGLELVARVQTLPSTSTAAGLPPFNELHAVSLPAAPGIDDVDGFNTNSIAPRVPLQKLTKDHRLPSGPNDPDAVVGVWATASR